MKFPVISLMLCTVCAHAADDDWRAAAEARIQAHRMGTVEVVLHAKDGTPLPGATVRIEQQQHAFPFGSTLRADRFIETDDAHPYRRHMKALFNTTVLGNRHKWRWWEDTDDRAAAEAALAWARANGMRVRGHTMLWQCTKWGPPLPRDVKTMLESDQPDRTALAQRVDEHLVAQATTLSPDIYEFDVINEPVQWHWITDTLAPGASPAALHAQWFQTVHEQAPQARLAFNDFHILVGDHQQHRDRYYQIIEAAIAAGAPVSAIGFQGHFYHGKHRIPPDETLARLDRFASFGLPLVITEFDTFGAGWGESQDEREQAQAAYLDQMLTLAFSHPAVDGFVIWGFWDGQHWSNTAPLFRKDWTPKPGLAVWQQRIFADWWTRDEAVSDGSGRVSFRAFKGTHRITITVDGVDHVVHLRLAGERVVHHLRPDD